MSGVYIGLGTNLGDRAVNLRKALEKIADVIKQDQQSPVFESEAVGVTEQPYFLNQVVSGTTDLPPFDLLSALKRIESEMGRIPSYRNGPRLIDLDLLFYQDWVYSADGLFVPHPRWRERSFVLAPLAEIAPDLRDPLTGKTAGEIWAKNRETLPKAWPFE